MPSWLLIGLGGFLGAICRYWISGWIQHASVSFPLGTLGVNFIGSFFLSLILYLFEYEEYFTEQQRIFLTIGVLGSFTTMSTFSYESFKLLEQRENMLFAMNVAGTILLTLAAVYLGRFIVMNLWKV